MNANAVALSLQAGTRIGAFWLSLLCLRDVEDAGRRVDEMTLSMTVNIHANKSI
jgi:hypothetical protein